MGGGFTIDPSQRSSNLPPHTRTSWLLIVLTSTAVIGGFLFGYDTGIISGAMIIMRTQFRLNDIWQEMIVSATVGAAAVGALLAGYLNQKFGRKSTILGSSVLFIIGSIVLAVAPTKAYLLIGRILLGVAIGVSSSTIPAYIAESSPPHIRGRMITMFQLQITFGFFCASLVAGALTYVEDNNVNWRIMLGLAAIPAALQLVGFFVMPESPRWLATKGREQQAYDVLVRIYGGDELARQQADFELKLIKESEEESQNEKDALGAQNQLPILTMLRTPHLVKALIIGCSMQMFAQLSGINTVMYYSASIIMMSGVSSPSLAIWSALWVAEGMISYYYSVPPINAVCTFAIVDVIKSNTLFILLGLNISVAKLTTVTSGVNFLSTFIAIYLVERIGRRLLLLCSIAGVFVCLVILGIAFSVVASQSPKRQPGIVVDDCSLHSCDACSYVDYCGWCFDKNNPYSPGSCTLHSNDSEVFGDPTLWALKGDCGRNTTLHPNPKDFEFNVKSAAWDYGYCPTTVSWLPILGMVLYLCFFAIGSTLCVLLYVLILAGSCIGYGPVPWTINAEIFPNWARSTGTSLSTMSQWLFNLVISLTFLTLARAISRQGAYFLYAAITLVSLIWFYLVLPETKHRPIEEVQALLMGPWITMGKETTNMASHRNRSSNYGGASESETNLASMYENEDKQRIVQQRPLKPHFDNRSHSNRGFITDDSSETARF